MLLLATDYPFWLFALFWLVVSFPIYSGLLLLVIGLCARRDRKILLTGGWVLLVIGLLFVFGLVLR